MVWHHGSLPPHRDDPGYTGRLSASSVFLPPLQLQGKFSHKGINFTISFQFHPWSGLIQDSAREEEAEENPQYVDIVIPVPYDPNIPGLRCEDIENGHVIDTMITELPN